MGVWSVMTRFIKGWLNGKPNGSEPELIPKYLPLIPDNQKEWSKDSYLTSLWAQGYVPTVHDKLMNSGTGNEIVVVAAEYISGKPLSIDVTGVNGSKDENLTKQLKEALRIDNFDSKSVKIVELAGGSGVSAVKINILNGRPSISVHSSSQFWIDFKNNEPFRFNFFEEIPTSNKADIYYLVESREIKQWDKEGKKLSGGFVTYSVIKIDGDKTTPINAERLPEQITSYLYTNDIQLNHSVSIGLKSMGAYLINNSPSNTRYPHLNLGESDLSQCTNYLFAVDYFFTVYMREGEKTKTKIAASERMFRKKVNKSTDKEEWSMNVDEDYFMQFKGTLDAGAKLNDMIQFMQGDFRDGSYRETMEYFAQKAVSKSGYNPATFNLGNREVKATEIWSLQDATVRKIEKKKRLIQNVYEQMLWDFLYLLTGGTNNKEKAIIRDEIRVIIEFPDPMTVNLNELSSTLNNMNSALAMSVEEKVKLIHPKWEDEEVQAEVKRIYLENSIGEVPDPEAIGGIETKGG
ncbi:hypothetical protein A6C02_05500 [Listeria monocytogenes]|nr:hypothetical protein [Listeria monocytogenes]